LFGQETYIHFEAQETRIIRKLFIFPFFLSKKLEIADLFDEKKLKMNNFLIILVSWATK